MPTTTETLTDATATVSARKGWDPLASTGGAAEDCWHTYPEDEDAHYGVIGQPGEWYVCSAEDGMTWDDARTYEDIDAALDAADEANEGNE